MFSVLRDRQGANIVFVIIIMMLLGIMVAVFAMTSSFSVRSSSVQREVEQGYYLARGVTTSVADSVVSADGNSAMLALQGLAEADYNDYLQALYRWQQDGGEGDRPALEAYVKEKYTTAGRTENIDGAGAVAVVTLTYDCRHDLAKIDTTVTYQGDDFTVGATLKTPTPTPTPIEGEGGDPVTAATDYAMGMASVGSVTISRPYKIYADNGVTNLGTLAAAGNVNIHSDMEGNILASGVVNIGHFESFLFKNRFAGGSLKGSILTANNVNLYGNVSGGGTITSTGGNVTISVYPLDFSIGDWITDHDIVIDADIVTSGNVTTTYGDGWQTLANSVGSVTVNGDIKTNNNVILRQKTAVNGALIAQTLTVTAASCSFRDITVRNPLTLSNSTVVGNITCGNDLTLTDCNVNGNIDVQGTVTLVGNCEINGKIHAANAIEMTGANVTGNYTTHEKDYSFTVPAIETLQFDEVKVQVPNLTAPYPTQNLIFGLDDPNIQYTKITKTNITIDATERDQYYEFSNDTLALNQLEIQGEHRVFLRYTPKYSSSTLTISTSGTSSPAYSDKLFIFSTAKCNLRLSNNSIIPAQIYMPNATLASNNSGNAVATVFGLLVVNGDLTGADKLTVHRMPADWSDTGLEDYFGGTTTPTGPTEVDLSANRWTVEKYYDL